MQASKRRPSPALVVAIIALVASLMGTAYAAQLGKNSVGSRQLKSKAVTTGKIANNAVRGAKVAKNSLTGADINLDKLGTVPNASSAQSAPERQHGRRPRGRLSGRLDPDPRRSALTSRSTPPSAESRAAANACAAKGGYLPTPMMLYSVRNVINLGTGVAPDYAVADQYYAEHLRHQLPTVTVDGTGKIEELGDRLRDTSYICAYQLVR